MTPRPAALLVLSLLALVAVSLAAAPAAWALKGCNVKEKKDGTLQIQAREVSGTLRVGTSPEAVRGRFANEDRCLADGEAHHCVMGPKDSIERTMHPPFCAFYLEDDEDSCTAKVADCTAGTRPVCPPDMERIGGECIDRTNSEDEFAPAVAECAARGRNLCSAETILECDTINLSSGVAGSCGTLTDASGTWVWTRSSASRDGENFFNGLEVYRNDNLVRENPSNIGSIYAYFCCAPLGTP